MPTLVETHQAIAPAKKLGVNFRCMAYKQANHLFVAECIDLNLMVKAKSMNKATESLREAIAGYLEVAREGDIKGLIPRPSPISRKALYHWVGIKARIARIKHLRDGQ